MNEPALPRGARRASVWLAPAFVGLLIVPVPVAAGLLAGALLVKVGGRLLRRVAAARGERARVARELAGGAFVLGVGIGRGAAGGRDPVALLGDRELSAHGLILGASGAGKSTTVLRILTERIGAGRPVVAIDLKGSPAFARELRAAAGASGRPFRCWSPEGPEHWNPLAHGNATELKDKLIATERFTEPHYRRAAERYVQLALQVQGELAGAEGRSLAGLVELLDPRRLAAAAARLPGPARERMRDYLASLAPDQLSAVRGLASRLAVITESHTGPFLERSPGRDGIDLRRSLDGGEVVVFSLNSSTYGSLAAQLGTLAVQDLVSAAGHRLGVAGGTPVPATVAIDEFSALGSDNVLALLARGREAGVSVLLATQELADLDRAARGLRDQVLGNTAVKIVHRQDVPESAAAAARLAGTERVWERSYQLGPGVGGRGLASARGGALRQVERPVFDPNRIRTLSTGEALVVVKSPSARAGLTRVLPPARGGDGGRERS